MLQIQSQVSRFKHFTEEIARNQGLVHIFEKIFFALDSKTLENCSLVSRKMNAILTNPTFWFKICLKKKLCYVEIWKDLLESIGENVQAKKELIQLLKIMHFGIGQSFYVLG